MDEVKNINADIEEIIRCINNTADHIKHKAYNDAISSISETVDLCESLERFLRQTPNLDFYNY